MKEKDLMDFYQRTNKLSRITLGTIDNLVDPKNVENLVYIGIGNIKTFDDDGAIKLEIYDNNKLILTKIETTPIKIRGSNRQAFLGYVDAFLEENNLYLCHVYYNTPDNQMVVEHQHKLNGSLLSQIDGEIGNQVKKCKEN